MISYRFVSISSQKGVLFLRHPVYKKKKFRSELYAKQPPSPLEVNVLPAFSRFMLP